MTAVTSGFGLTLAGYRKRLGISQRILAERVGLTPSHLSRIEHDSRKPPNAPVINRMVEVLHLSRDEAETLVKLAGYSPLILVSNRNTSHVSALMESPISLRDDSNATSSHEELEEAGWLLFEHELRIARDEAKLSPEAEATAQRLVLETVRIIFRVLSDEKPEPETQQ